MKLYDQIVQNNFKIHIFAGDWLDIPRGSLSCPPGLEYLASVDQLLFNQKVEFFAGFEKNIKFDIKNASGEIVRDFFISFLLFCFSICIIFQSINSFFSIDKSCIIFDLKNLEFRLQNRCIGLPKVMIVSHVAVAVRIDHSI